MKKDKPNHCQIKTRQINEKMMNELIHKFVKYSWYEI